MIPKTIHYCWFGRGEKPRLAQKCIASWRKYCPDYEIIEWNEDNFDLDRNAYTRWCYDNRKWAFLSDYVRLAVVAEHGGIYFDTDVELVRSINELLKQEAFYAFETPEHIATGLGFGAEAQHPTICAMEQIYQQFSPDDNGNFTPVGCPALNTKALESFGLTKNGQLQTVSGALLLPVDYMNPYDNPTGRLNKTSNTYSIHWYSKSALSKKAILRSKLARPFHRLLGNNCFLWLKK